MLQERTEFFPVTLPPPEVLIESKPVFVLKDKGDISLIPEGTTFVYIQRQPIATLRFVSELLDRNSDIKKIQFMPSLSRMVGPGMRALFAGKSIEVAVVRRINRPNYDRTYNGAPRNYEEKLAVWELAWEDEIKRRILETAKSHLPEFKIMELYFNGERLSLQAIARKLRLPFCKVQKNFSAFMHIAGLKSLDHNTRCRAHQIEADTKRIRLEEAGISTQKLDPREERRKSFAIGGELPPVALFQDRWENWQKVKRKLFENPGLWEELEKVEPRCGLCLDAFYQLGKYNQGRSLEQVAGKFRPKISKERARQLKNRALDYLGLRESSKILK